VGLAGWAKDEFPGLPDVYTRVQNYTKWIDESMEDALMD